MYTRNITTKPSLRNLQNRYGISPRDFPEDDDDDDYSSSPYALCEAMAKKRQWRVSKSHGRYDAHRAGLEFVRDVATGVFPLWFYPPAPEDEDEEE